MKRICLIFFVILGLLGNSLYAQERRVTGTVTDAETGATLPGVTVMVQGTTIGTITDIDGRYDLTVTPQNVLVFSSVGMASQQITVGDRTVINVALAPDVAMLQEIVVTALGISRERKSLGYAVQEVRGEEIARSNNPNLGTALSGKIAGLEVRQSSGMPGAPTTIMIRGARNFTGNNQPLYVVDGMPITSGNDYAQNVTGAYNANRSLDIDPADIESITVLKGQAAAALYGLRANNGVIIITTKSGRGAAPDRPLIQVSTSFSQDVIARLPELQQTYAQGAWNAAQAKPIFAPVNSFAWGPRIDDLPNDPVYGGNNHGQPGLFFHPQKNEWVEPRAYNAAEGFFENGGTFNTNVSVSQAGPLGNYSVGLGSAQQTGIVMNTGMERYTGRFSGTMNLSPIFKTGFSGNIANTSLKKLPSGNDSWLFTVLGAPPSYDLMGTPFNVPSGPYNEYRQISYRGGAVGENPLWAVRNNHFLESTQRFFGNAFIVADPASWINIRYQLGLDSYSTDQEVLYQVGSSRNQGLPTAAMYPRPDNREYGYNAPAGGEIQNYGVIRNNVNSLLNISMNYDFTDELRGLLIVGNEFVNNQSRFWSMTGTGFTMPGYNNMANTTTQSAGESKFQSRTVGFYGNAALEWRDMLFLNMTGRQDIVSTMPRDNRSFFYPSVSLGWVFTELPALQDNAILPFGKLRVSYAEVGQAGNYNVPTYSVGGGEWSGFISGISFPLGSVSGFRPSRTLYDPALMPQNTETLEFGLELRFVQNRIGLDYTYSDQDARNQIFNVPLAGSTGYGFLVMNAGHISTQTHEIQLMLNPVRTANFDWTLNTNFTTMENIVLELAEGVENISLGGYVTPNIRASAGDPYPAIYGNQYRRDEQGRILVNEDPTSPGYGMPLMGDFGKIGTVNPDFYFSVTNILTYRAFTVSAQLDWKQGGQMYSGSNRLMDLYGVTAATGDRTNPFVWDGYKADGTPNDIERGGPDDLRAYEYLHATIRSPLDESHVYGTSFVKLRDITLSVNLPRAIIAPIGMRSANISFFARNILLWTELPNFDPETAQGMGNMVGGMDYMSLPQTTAFGIGVNLSF